MTVDYHPLGDVYDEMLDGDGRPRAHWEQLADAFGEIGLAELQRRGREAARLLDQDGVVYNAYAERSDELELDFGEDASVADASAVKPQPRSWKLDPLPTIVSSREWADIEAGVIERAELLSMVLEDVYGERELLRRRLLPPEVVFGHPGFLRACDQIRLPLPQQLFSYAADLGRDRDGNVVVLSDRTQAPSGAGYALENRTVISRVLPTLYRDTQVHRLAPFFRSLRAALQEAAPAHVDDPRIVVLTPGPLNETAFEHAALASTLGYPLVQGRDLTVRGEKVWMRSVGQYEPVDVILRRVDSGYCDPLELRPDSQLGVPGLLEVARAGNVSIVNPVGSAVLENPALMAFLPRLGEHLLGREPRLASAPTWWCGDPDSCAYVLEHLDQLVLRPVSAEHGISVVLGSELSTATREWLAARIRARPAEWVGQEMLAMSSVPVLTETGLESRRSVLRTFATARHESFTVMPGGLTRVERDGGMMRISNAAGAITKDTWVLASEPEPLSAFWLQSGPAVAGIDPMASIPSGAAESLWWLGRYAERAEALTRLTRAVIDRTNEFGGGTNAAGSACLEALDSALAWLAGRNGTYAIARSLRAMLDNAYAVRDQLSRDTWLVIGPLEQVLLELERPVEDVAGVSQGALQQVIQSLLALGGLGVESMVRDLGWRFMDAGRRLERSLQLLSLLSATVQQARGTAVDSLMLESILSAAESIITYRFRYRSHAQLETVLDLLLLDEGNPRSLAYQLGLLTEDLAALPPDPLAHPRLRPEQRSVLEASTALRLADPPTLVSEHENGWRPDLADLLTTLSGKLLDVGAAVDATYFIRPQPSFNLVGPAGSEPTVVRGAGVSTVYEVRHSTEYTYKEPVTASYGQLHMLPRELSGQRCRSAAVTITPVPEVYRERVDFFGNRVSTFVLHEPHTVLNVTAVSVVEVEDRAAELSLFGEQSWESVAAAARSSQVDYALSQYLMDSPLIELRDMHLEYARESFPPGGGVLEAITSLTHRIHTDFEYKPGSTSVSTPLEEVFAKHRGVCQDFAHAQIACLRAVGIPARYVSGYLETDPPPGRPKLTGVDGSHAWLSVFVPDTGWVAVDPTNDQYVNGRYVTTAVGRDYNDVPPMQGVIYTNGKTNQLEVKVDVSPLSPMTKD